MTDLHVVLMEDVGTVTPEKSRLLGALIIGCVRKDLVIEEADFHFSFLS